VTDPVLVPCAGCGATNRVPRARLGPASQAVCGRCKRALPVDTAPVVVTDATFADEVLRWPLPVVVDLWAAWCGPCRAIAPVVEEMAGELAGRVRFAKVDVDANPHTASRFDARSIPTLLVMRGGREVDRIVGAVPKAEIARRLTPFLAS
jgi:thioredoxin 2